jgi:hypothetical protein
MGRLELELRVGTPSLEPLAALGLTRLVLEAAGVVPRLQPLATLAGLRELRVEAPAAEASVAFVGGLRRLRVLVLDVGGGGGAAAAVSLAPIGGLTGLRDLRLRLGRAGNGAAELLRLTALRMLWWDGVGAAEAEILAGMAWLTHAALLPLQGVDVAPLAGGMHDLRRMQLYGDGFELRSPWPPAWAVLEHGGDAAAFARGMRQPSWFEQEHAQP